MPFLKTYLVSDSNQGDYPLIMKSRTGSGSKANFIIYDKADLMFYAKKYPDFLFQEYIRGEDSEYTCGLFRSSKGEIRTIILKRKLMGGFTASGAVIENDTINQLLQKVADELNLTGSINVQLKFVQGRPLIFEINPRFSSTVHFRHLLGFEDVIWSIQDLLGIAISSYLAPKKHRKFYKGFNEYVV